MNKKFLKYDIYSKQIGFFFHDHDKVGTYYGLLLTLLYIFISFLLFIVCISITIKRTNLIAYDSTIYSQDLPVANINPNSLYFAFGLEDPTTSNRFIDETIYYPQLLFFERLKENGEFKTINKKELEYEPCKEKNFGENYKKLISEGDFNNSYCLKDFNLTLAGGYKYDKFNYLRIKIFACKNGTENNYHCKPQDIIDNYLKGGYFSIITKDIGLNPSNISYPVIHTLQNIYTTIDKSMYRELILYYGITEIRTDMGLFYENLKTERYLQFRKDIQSFYFRNESEYYEGKAISSIDFRLDDLIHVQKRSYTKMHETFSIIGGYMQLASTALTLLSFLTNKLIPELKILNEIFNFNIKEKKLCMKIQNLKDYSSLISNNEFYCPFRNQNNNINNKDKNNKNNNSITKNSLIGINNNKDNITSIINSLNNKKQNMYEKTNQKENSNIQINASNLSLYIDKKDKQNNNIVMNKNYIYRVGSFYPKKFTFNDNQKEDIILKEYTHKINFNLFDYYCLSKISRKKKDIELFKLGLSLYKKRMDIINIFTFLLLSENKFLEEEEEH